DPSGQRYGFVGYGPNGTLGTNWYLADRSNTVLAVLSGTGVPQSVSSAVDTFGKPLLPDDPSGPKRFIYTNREAEPLSGLQYVGGQYYDPSLQRFISGDPTRRLGGSNPYEFANNSFPNTGASRPANPWEEHMKPTGHDTAGDIGAWVTDLFDGDKEEGRKIA